MQGGIGRDKIRWDEMGWDEMGWDEMTLRFGIGKGDGGNGDGLSRWGIIKSSEAGGELSRARKQMGEQERAFEGHDTWTKRGKQANGGVSSRSGSGRTN